MSKQNINGNKRDKYSLAPIPPPCLQTSKENVNIERPRKLAPAKTARLELNLVRHDKTHVAYRTLRSIHSESDGNTRLTATKTSGYCIISTRYFILTRSHFPSNSSLLLSSITSLLSVLSCEREQKETN